MPVVALSDRPPGPPSGPHSQPGFLSRPIVRAALFAAILLAGCALRLVPWPNVFTKDGIRFGVDGDPYYHVLRAQKIALEGEVLWHDREMNFPLGADVIWPPGFDALIAGVAWLSSAGAPTVEDVERAAAALPVFLGLVSIALTALLATELVGGGALAAALVLALSPLHAEFTAIGRADQHAAEFVLFLGCLLALARSLHGSKLRLGSGVALGALLALAFWNWQGSALYLLMLAAFAGGWHVWAPSGDPSPARVSAAIGLGAGAAAAFLVLSIALLGPPGALGRGGLAGVSALAPVACAATAAGAAALALMARRPASRLRRLAEVATVGTAALVLVAAPPAVRSGIHQGLLAMGSGEPWYGLIREFQPRFGRVNSFAQEATAVLGFYGLAPVAAMAGAVALLRGHPERPDRGPMAPFAVFLGVVFFALALFRVRFDLYAIAPLAILASSGIRAFAQRVMPRKHALVQGFAIAIIVSPMLLGIDALAASDWPREEYAKLSRRLGATARSGARGAVLATWERGHEVRYFSGLPVLATPFGIEGGPGALVDAGRFWLADTQEEAEAVLTRRIVRWVIVQPPHGDLLLSAALLGRPPGASILEERPLKIGLLPGAARLVSSRMYYADGLATSMSPPLSAFRLLDEGKFLGTVPVVKLFELVPGAILRVSGAAPGAEVRAVARLTTRLGRSLPYEVRGAVGSDGAAVLRVPYATGWNGQTRASEYMVESVGRATAVAISEDDVVTGRVVAVRFP